MMGCRFLLCVVIALCALSARTLAKRIDQRLGDLAPDPPSWAVDRSASQEFMQHCATQNGELFGRSCKCKSSANLVCIKDGEIGCGKDRKFETQFSEADGEFSATECVKNPCREAGGEMVYSQANKHWYCDCKGVIQGKFCHRDGQPCPETGGLERESQFFAKCTDCQCKVMARAPVENKELAFRDACTASGGDKFGVGICKCSTGNKKAGNVCFGLDGKIGCNGKPDTFVESECEETSDGGLRCPTCSPNPCAGKGAHLVVPGRDYRAVVRSHSSTLRDGYTCDCDTDFMRCFEDDQPGCSDDIVTGLRWQSGFPTTCTTCFCEIRSAYPQSGLRFIYPSENLCAPTKQFTVSSTFVSSTQRPDEAVFDFSASKRAGALRCACSNPATTCKGSDDCPLDGSLDPLACPACRCDFRRCPDPEAPEGARVQREPGNLHRQNSDSDLWLHGDRAKWSCGERLRLEGSDVTECLESDSFSEAPPRCTPCPGDGLMELVDNECISWVSRLAGEWRTPNFFKTDDTAVHYRYKITTSEELGEIASVALYKEKNGVVSTEPKAESKSITTCNAHTDKLGVSCFATVRYDHAKVFSRFEDLDFTFKISRAAPHATITKQIIVTRKGGKNVMPVTLDLDKTG